MPFRGRFKVWLAALILIALQSGLFYPSLVPARAQAAVYQPQAAMEYVPLCDAKAVCKQFSRLVMGTDHLVQAQWTDPAETEISETELFDLLDEALRLGINTFDTSPIYVGGIEKRLGKWLKSRQLRIAQQASYYQPTANPDRDVYVISKGGFPFDLYASRQLPPGQHSAVLIKGLQQSGMLAPNALDSELAAPLQALQAGTYASRLFGQEDQITSRLTEELEHTVRHLQTRIAVYLMHRDDADFIQFQEVSRAKTPVTTIMSALSNDPLSQHYWLTGWSNWQTARIQESLQVADQNPRLKRPALNSPYFSLFEMSARTIHAGGVQVQHAEMMQPAFQAGIRIMPYSPLGGYSIFDQPLPVWEHARQRAKKAADSGDAYWQNVYQAVFTPDNAARFARLERFTERFNHKHDTDYSLDQMVNAYALAHPRTDYLAIGPRTIPQLRRTVEALRLA